MNRLGGFKLWSILIGSLFMASSALADIVASGSQPFTQPSGFYSGVKSVTVYTEDDPGNPMPGGVGELTYVYSITNDSGSFLSIIGFNLAAPVDSVVSAGSVSDADPSTSPPSAVINDNDGVVRWDWAAASGVISPGTTSDELYVVSAFTPGTITDTIFSLEGEFAFGLESTTIGPVDPPVAECDLEIVKDGCVVQPPSPPGDACKGKVKSFKFEYTGLGCDASSNLQDPKKTLCLGGADGQDPVDIIVYGSKHKRSRGWWGWWNKRKSKKVFASFKDVSVGDVLTVDAEDGGKKNLGSKTRVKIKTANGWYHDIIEFNLFRTACSQPLGPGHQFGSIKITELTSTKGGTVQLEEDPPSEECVTAIDVTPAPHCLGRVEKLTLRYTGGDCSQTLHSQDPSKVGCWDSSPAETYPVRVILGETASPSSDAYVDLEPLNIGETFVVDATTVGCNTKLKSETGFWIKDAATDGLVQDGFFHTSCSQPLNLGDQFGALQVYAMETTQGGTVSLAHEVEYTYEITNPNATEATGVSIDDDQIGNIASGITLGAGMTETFIATALISEATTNVATLNGFVDGVACNEATASATISVVEPPDPGAICTTKVQAMRLRYTGPDVLGARVEIEASKFSSDVVVYDPIDLLGGVSELTLAAENGFSIDATAHGEIGLGTKTRIRIDGTEEVLHTSCSTPFESGKAAPLQHPKGDPSVNWFVIDFTQKN
ncbi:hypothetical protein MK489_19790 [Myxococcota bacterium]|nr:hypothetical protein [Myxococcota bacterium]